MGVWTATPYTPPAGGVGSSGDFEAGITDGLAAFGAMTAYTPSFAGWTLGNGTLVGAYTQIQKTVLFRAQLTLGSTSAAASDSPKFTVPVPAAATFAVGRNGLEGTFIDTGSNTYMALARWETVSTVGLSIPGTNGVRTVPSTTTPFTWATGDIVVVSGWYVAA